MEEQGGEWSSATDEPDRHAQPEEQSGKQAEAKTTQGAKRQLLLSAVALAAISAGTIALFACDPPVSASVETEAALPPRAAISLVGGVSTQPIQAELGTLSLSWMSPPAGPVTPSESEVIWLIIDVSRHDCIALSQVAGRCGDGKAPTLRAIEGLRLESHDEPLIATATATAAERFRLEQHGISDQGTPVEWALTENAARTRIEVSCSRPVRFALTITPRLRGVRMPFRSTTCEPTGIRYRLRIVNDAPVATTIGFNRLREFVAVATANVEGRIGIDHGTVGVDGDSSTISGGQSTPVVLRPEREGVELRVTSPVAEGPGEVRMDAPRAAAVLVAGEERTPNELERVPELVIATLLIPGALLLARGAVIPAITLMKGRRTNANRS